MGKNEKKKPSKALIIAILAGVAAVGAIVTLIIILSGGKVTIDPPQDSSGNTNSTIEDKLTDLDGAVRDLPNQAALDFIFSRLDGYWTSGNLFVNFIANSGNPTIQYGLYGTSYGEAGEVKGAEVTGTNAFCLTVLIAATPANEMDGARPERTETICIDVSNTAKESKLNIKIDNSSIGGREWQTYEFGGSSLEETYKDRVIEE